MIQIAELHREQPREEDRLLVLVADVHGDAAVDRDVARHLERRDRLADARRTADDHEITAANAAAEDGVERIEARGERNEVLGRAAAQLLVERLENVGHCAWLSRMALSSALRDGHRELLPW